MFLNAFFPNSITSIYEVTIRQRHITIRLYVSIGEEETLQIHKSQLIEVNYNLSLASTSDNSTAVSKDVVIPPFEANDGDVYLVPKGAQYDWEPYVGVAVTKGGFFWHPTGGDCFKVSGNQGYWSWDRVAMEWRPKKELRDSLLHTFTEEDFDEYFSDTALVKEGASPKINAYKFLATRPMFKNAVLKL